jgi:membrane-bound lytic murein transglycosylase B
MAQQRDFAAWLQELRGEAVALGIRPRTLDAALTGLRPLLRVIELDRKQPEDTLTYAQYLERTLPAARVQKGLRLLNEHRALLQDIGTRYDVPPGIIVALWGMETDFGRATAISPSSPLWRRSPMTVGAVRCSGVNCLTRSKSSMLAMCVLEP